MSLCVESQLGFCLRYWRSSVTGCGATPSSSRKITTTTRSTPSTQASTTTTTTTPTATSAPVASETQDLSSIVAAESPNDNASAIVASPMGDLSAVNYSTPANAEGVTEIFVATLPEPASFEVIPGIPITTANVTGAIPDFIVQSPGPTTAPGRWQLKCSLARGVGYRSVRLVKIRRWAKALRSKVTDSSLGH